MLRKPVAAATSKEDTLFKEALKLYESKHYKKSLKNCDQILKKSSCPVFAEALALKALNLHFLKEYEESESYVNKAIQKNETSPVVNHILGILRRVQLRYKEAQVFFKKALDCGSMNKQIWRDLSVMELQNRDYRSVSKSRHAYLEEFLGYRANWTGLATAHHLNKDYDAGERTLTKFEELVKGKLNDGEMYENSELLMYKNQLIFESGDVERALKDLEDIETFDKLEQLEWKAKYLLKLGDNAKASKVIRELLKRNPDNIKYYQLLEVALGTFDKSAKYRDGLYQKLVKFYPKSDAPRFIPLFFTEGELFVERVTKYLTAQLSRGVPAAFSNIKPLLKRQPAKIAIVEKIVLEFYETEQAKEPQTWIWTTYFLAQHFLYVKNLNKAKEFVDAAIKHTPTLVELYIFKARVLKHLDQHTDAAETINEGRLTDLQDRFINTKTVKYYLRANNIEKALELVSIFTKNDENSKNGLKDLHTMQVNWFLIENAEAYLRLYQNALKSNNYEDSVRFGGLALKRFKAIVKVYEEYYNDQLDFHTFCMRRGTVRAYIDMLKWEDGVYKSSVYVRAVKGAAKILLFGEKAIEPMDESGEVKDKKKDKKEKAARSKQLDAEKAALVAYSPEEDSDVFGAQLYTAEDWIKLFQEQYFHHLLEQGDGLIATNDLSFHLNFKLKKIPLAIAALNKLRTLTHFKYENLPAYLLTVKFKLNEEGLNKILAEKLLVKNFPEFDFSNIDLMIQNYLDLETVKGLLGLVNLVNLNLEGVKNDVYKQEILSKAEKLEPVEKTEILNALK